MNSKALNFVVSGQPRGPGRRSGPHKNLLSCIWQAFRRKVTQGCPMSLSMFSSLGHAFRQYAHSSCPILTERAMAPHIPSTPNFATKQVLALSAALTVTRALRVLPSQLQVQEGDVFVLGPARHGGTYAAWLG